MTIKKSMRGLLVVSVLTLLAVPAVARRPAAVDCADLVDSACISELESLCIATENAGSLKNRDRNALVGKVLGANVKLVQDKVDDGGAKLDDYDRKLNALNEARKPKISEDDFGTLLEGLLAAQLCVGSL